MAWEGETSPRPCPRVLGATGLAAAHRAASLEGLPRLPRSTSTPLLTWAAVVRISIYTFQEGDTR